MAKKKLTGNAQQDYKKKGITALMGCPHQSIGH
jgi:hypothetical protein